MQASGKGKRPLCPSATPAPKRRLTDDHEGKACFGLLGLRLRSDISNTRKNVLSGFPNTE